MDNLTQHFWRKIEQYYGIRFSENRNKSVIPLAESRAHKLGLNSVELYLDLFGAGKLLDEEYRFWATELTINETYFFRDDGQWEAIREKVIPDIIRANAPSKVFRAISLGCSSGEEPYTLAMILQYYFRGLPGWQVAIDATDIKEELLEKAIEGKFSERSVKGIPREIADRYIRGSMNTYTITDDIKSMVNFHYHNILDLPNKLRQKKYDLIFCRNVIIYFSKEVAIRVIQNMLSLLPETGYLALGHSEGHLTGSLDLEPVFTHASVLYRKRKADRYRAQTEFDVWSGLKRSTKYVSESVKKESSAQRAHSTSVEFPIQFPDALVDDAQQLIEKHDYVAAKQKLEKAVQQLPLYTPAHYLLGMLYQILQETEKAIKQFERVIHLDPNNILGYLQCAMLYQQKGKLEEAEKLFQRILHLTEELDKGYVVDKHSDMTVGFVQMLCKNLIQNKQPMTFAYAP